MNRIQSFLKPEPGPRPTPAVTAQSTLDEKRAAIRESAARLQAAVAVAGEQAAALEADPTPERARTALVAINGAAAVINEAEQLWGRLCPGAPLPVDMTELRAEVAALLAVASRTMPTDAGNGV